ncbi:MarR family winged helix-turn-helix transcriptional regulator [Actinocrispum wychmicini]|uniref:DNA-binding MarR family transcriptional regulator n=1 Tax=Actinocrispum wychmicini TaxID=1213861 RepID=A0A4R2KF58_9PSEU|nr:MarR family transcriptional regulator [Actinocrispum wychmicini]TCO65175.1 DNA-binding MarR family transcriptional regulator [Actinocrispum wychmicini]
MSTDNRAGLLAAIQEASRISVSRTVSFQQAVAARLGIGSSDLNCLNLLQLAGPMTAGKLAEEIGLTKGGAITAALDRLERAGMIERERDPADRRRIIIRPTQRVIDLVGPLMPADVWENLYDRYTDDELRVVLDFTERSSATVQTLIDRVSST